MYFHPSLARLYISAARVTRTLSWEIDDCLVASGDRRCGVGLRSLSGDCTGIDNRCYQHVRRPAARRDRRSGERGFFKLPGFSVKQPGGIELSDVPRHERDANEK